MRANESLLRILPCGSANHDQQSSHNTLHRCALFPSPEPPLAYAVASVVFRSEVSSTLHIVPWWKLTDHRALAGAAPSTTDVFGLGGLNLDRHLLPCNSRSHHARPDGGRKHRCLSDLRRSRSTDTRSSDLARNPISSANKHNSQNNDHTRSHNARCRCWSTGGSSPLAMAARTLARSAPIISPRMIFSCLDIEKCLQG